MNRNPIVSKNFAMSMNTKTQICAPTLLRTAFPLLPCCTLLLAMAFPLVIASSGVTTGRVFQTPAEAVAELGTATATRDPGALIALFGTTVEELQNPDRTQATNDLSKFHAALVATNHLVKVSETNIIIEVGEDAWPFPIPLVKERGGWHFDTAAGQEEILTRRIGKNELEVLAAMRAYVDAQREYAGQDRDDDKVLEYAQKLASSPGKTDGLYWPTELNGQVSPLGPLVAEAQGKGYRKTDTDEPEAFNGYYFKILTRQGKNAPGGKYDYVINGNMIGGFGMVAWPAGYGDTGIMTFLVNQQGRVYQKDLGEKTSKIASKINEYNPDSTWKESKD
jgi:hypothetical protein